MLRNRVNMAPEIFLFTYDISVFGRKIEWYLTLRGIKYYKCIQRNRLPRPDLEALGVKYRRIPILAIGRDVYCDTRCIIPKLEQLFPSNRLGSSIPFEQGIEYLLENWIIDGGPFWRTAALIPPISEVMNDPSFIADRSEMTGATFDQPALVTVRPDALVHSRIYFNMFENFILGDGRKYVLDTETPTLADIHAMWVFDWTLSSKMNMFEALEKDAISKKLFPRTFAWVERFRTHIESLGGQSAMSEQLSGSEVVERILNSDFFEEEAGVDTNDPLKLKLGQPVEISPTDNAQNHHDSGTLVILRVSEVVIASKVPGDRDALKLHFPRTNFKILAVKNTTSNTDDGSARC